MNKIFSLPPVELGGGYHDYSATKEKRFQTLDETNGISVVLGIALAKIESDRSFTRTS